MNIQVTHFVCKRCEVNGQWMYDTPVGLMRLYFVHSGEGVVYNFHREHKLKPNKLYLFTQHGDFHTVDAHKFDHSFFNFHANYAVKPEYFLEFDRSEFPFIDFNKLSEMLQNKDKYENTLRALLTALLSFINENIGLPIISNDTVLRSIDIIQQQSATITTSSLAKELCINESHFIRIFKKQLGLTPMQYIRACKIAKGITYLQNGMNISDASEKCGYSSSVAFSQAFKSETGALPSHYLKKKGI